MALDPAKREGFITRDEDVLDTWFSSGLWPFSTLGWPDDTPEVKRYYPTNTLVTGFDIIFFWVARMMMMGLHFMKEVPFKDIYIHALVRDEKGAKMSKSKGNVIDPLDLIDKFGADALRFTLAAMAAQGRDIKLSTQRVEGYRNFATKLWNAARFAEMNACALPAGFDPKTAKETLNRWIAHETARAAREVTEAIQSYRFNEAAGAVYRFVWNIYCDWYLELAKPVLTGPDGAAKSETRAMVAWARDEILKMLHPFMPFITEELWEVTADAKRGRLLTLAQWPAPEGLEDEKAEGEIGWVVDLVTAVRSLRSEMNIPPATLIPLTLVGASAETAGAGAALDRRGQAAGAAVGDLVRACDAAGRGAVAGARRGGGAAAEGRDRSSRPRNRGWRRKSPRRTPTSSASMQSSATPNFMANAPEEVVEEQRERREEAEARRAKIARGAGAAEERGVTLCPSPHRRAKRRRSSNGYWGEGAIMGALQIVPETAC